ncbi:hypothetical protein [Paenibacillus planticolens]|uniref:Uncharacterized protein n=1 Tax=Paenibacillus planticolens TaxID=2654976 RepID=A0ABX1ZND3_9BACL|nr:hypothetical protein [Paenibacillus planticolens]NOV00397.1 hypothetical protein [Paenibacillus planticolens]
MALEPNMVSSFVLRFSSVGEEEQPEERRWRIRITHVQDQDEIVVGSMQEAFDYIEQALRKKGE